MLFRSAKRGSEFALLAFTPGAQPAREIYKSVFIPKVQQGLRSSAKWAKVENPSWIPQSRLEAPGIRVGAQGMRTDREETLFRYFRMDWLDLLAVQRTFKCLLQHHSSKASILRRSAFFTVQLSYPGKNTGVGCHFLLQGIFPTGG